MATANILEPRPTRPCWRNPLFRMAAGVVLLLLVGAIAFLVWKRQRDAEQLVSAIAEVDALDPGWRLDELEAKRKTIPDENNAALIILQANGLMPRYWPPSLLRNVARPDGVVEERSLESRLFDLPPNVQLDGADERFMRAEMLRVESALLQARKLERMSEGYFPIIWTKDFVSTPDYFDGVREVAELLAWDAKLRAQEGDGDSALASARGIFVAARSLGDESRYSSQVVRMARDNLGVATLERVLAQCEPTEVALVETQRLVQEEEAVPRLLIAARGERAGFDRALQAVEAGDIKASQCLASPWMYAGGRRPGSVILVDLQDRLTITEVRAVVLRRMTGFVETAKLPVELREPQIAQLHQALRDPEIPEIAYLILARLPDFGRLEQRTVALLRCTDAALAAERFRRVTGRWPLALAELSPAFLKEVPADPYDGQPLRCRRLGDRFVIYSTGPDLIDNGGSINLLDWQKSGSDLGFRLWDAPHRRQPFRPPIP